MNDKDQVLNDGFGGSIDLPMMSKMTMCRGHMAGNKTARRWRMVAGAALALVLAACAGKPLPPPPPPPPPLVEVPPPPRPTPPDGAAPTLVTPEIGADGQRESVNRKVSTNQIIWNLRSAYTVAALGCTDPRNSAILVNYRSFLTRNAAVLKSVYDAMDHEFRAKYQRGGEKLRDDYLTVLYNHYALPPTKDEFCDVVDQVLQAGITVSPDQLDVFATAKVPLIEKVFDDFYTRYDQYKNALAAWDEKYGRVGRVSVGQFAAVPPPPARPVEPYHNQVEAPPSYRAPYQAPVAAPVSTQVQVGPIPAPQEAPRPSQMAVQPELAPAPQPAPAPTPQPTQTSRLPDLLSGPQDGPVSPAPPRPIVGPPDTP